MPNRSRGRGQISELTHIAPIKQGVIPSPVAGDGRPIRYADRLRTVLEGFQVREDQKFPGVIRLFRGIHTVQWALLDGDTRLMVNVVFDGALHGYLRALARDVPGSLGLIWSNCEGWKDPSDNGQHLIDFIERHQIRVNFFYAQHPQLTVPDVEMLIQTRDAVESAATNGEGLDQLQARLYLDNAPIPHDKRQRDALSKHGDTVRSKDAFLQLLNALYEAPDVERAYYETFGDKPAARAVPATKKDALERASKIQSLILEDFSGAHAARMLFVRFNDPAGARTWLETTREKLSFGPRPQSTPFLNIGFTHEGLLALGVDQALLSAFPEAFAQGMHARAEQLGDPDPNRDRQPLPTSTDAHAILFLYAPSDPSSELTAALLEAGRIAQAAADDQSARLTTSDDSSKVDKLSATLAKHLDQLQVSLDLVSSKLLHGVEVIGSRDLHRPLVGEGPPANPYGVEYFGFRDGVAQPRLPIGGNYFDLPDEPASFEPVLRNDGVGLLRDSSFFVARQLRQMPEVFWQSMQERADQLGTSKKEVAEQIVGRRMDGRRLDSTQSRYDEVRDRHAFDPEREAPNCPFHSHTRRMNPRTERNLARNPRLMRRSLAFAETREDGVARGLMFMAFNADFEAQFELMQRHWVQAGNQVGLSSRDRDVLTGLASPSEAEPSVHRTRFYADLRGVRGRASESARELTFDDSFVRLEWGIYLYFPAQAALRQLG